MKVGEWYKQTFRDGDEVYFHAERPLKHGGFAGTQYDVDAGRPRAKAKAKKSSVHPAWIANWRYVSETDVPMERFR